MPSHVHLPGPCLAAPGSQGMGTAAAHPRGAELTSAVTQPCPHPGVGEAGPSLQAEQPLPRLGAAPPLRGPQDLLSFAGQYVTAVPAGAVSPGCPSRLWTEAAVTPCGSADPELRLRGPGSRRRAWRRLLSGAGRGGSPGQPPPSAGWGVHKGLWCGRGHILEFSVVGRMSSPCVCRAAHPPPSGWHGLGVRPRRSQIRLQPGLEPSQASVSPSVKRG